MNLYNLQPVGLRIFLGSVACIKKNLDKKRSLFLFTYLDVVLLNVLIELMVVD